MKKAFASFVVISVFCLFTSPLSAQRSALDSLFPVRGICVEAPYPKDVAGFVKFIDEELAPRGANTLIIRMDYRYQFKKHPELIDSMPLSYSDVKKIVAVCKKNNINVMPQVNLLGHQSWTNHLGKLLEVYPQFDETPWIPIPAVYKRDNPYGLYVKSYCPLHPDLHRVVFEVIDELCDAFESTAFHGGMDEVFYIAEEKCPRCQGHDPADLFAGEVRAIRDHLALSNRTLWIWGDRLLNGKITGLGKYEGSYANTDRAIDRMPKDVFICDWHYERPDKTAVLFANKGFQVATCPWIRSDVTRQQVADMAAFRRDATPQVRGNYAGVVQTVWGLNTSFMQEVYGQTPPDRDQYSYVVGAWKSFLTMMDTMKTIAEEAKR